MIKIIYDDYIPKNSIVIIIDAFRATTVMYYLFSKNIKYIIPKGNIQDAVKNKKKSLLIGEEKGYKPDIFDYNNSPYQLKDIKCSNKIITMSTSTGTKSILKFYKNNNTVLIGSFTNAKYLSEKIKNEKKDIYIYPTNKKEKEEYNEDIVCAKFIESLITNKYYDVEEKLYNIEKYKGLRFFKMDIQDRFPKEDFYLSTKLNIFNFVLEYKYGKIKKRRYYERNRKKIFIKRNS